MKDYERFGSEMVTNENDCVQDAGGSYDVNGHDADPQPRYDITNENRSDALNRCLMQITFLQNSL